MKTNERNTENQEIEQLKNEQKKTRMIGIVLLLMGAVCYVFIVLSPIFLVLGSFFLVLGWVLFVRSLKHSKFTPVKQENEVRAPQQNTQPVQTQLNSFNHLMTSQLVAFYLNKQPEADAAEYRNQYLSRLMKIGIDSSDAEKLFDFESEIIKKHDKQYLLSSTFTQAWFFGLNQRFFLKYPKAKDDILKERFLTMSELCKIIDEAEWHFWNSHERDLPEDVWEEIWEWHLKGAGGEFAIQYFEMIAEVTGVKEESVGLLSGEQGKHLSKYKWH